jgi:hypothetical protein
MRTPATPSTRRLDPVTETFATRDEVVEWTQRGSAFPKATEAPIDAATERDKTSWSRLRLAALLAAGFAVVAVLVRVRTPAERAETSRPPPAETAPAVVAPAPTPPAAPPEAPSGAAVPSPVATALASVERGPAPATEGAAFTLSSDLSETRVTFDGAPVGRAPITLKRPAGKHTVTFLSADLGEHLTTSVDAKSGESLKIRAQFKKPDPSILVRR